ncbi:MAG: glycosyltransferase family 4 protein [Paenibacillus macerans]|uniref:glycosyltransferase family 4 protein n=1 Tax=Paenibacillus TaxID=44249 RepID=UPI0029085BA1|nr:glycosyltransferase family 4 protein [Paenibacillus macerans]MDU7477363.1 glycosyltransferase family 4 protein [Paenibacillus macerans]
MNILMVAPEQIPVPGNGSVEICMLAIAKELADRHTVTILSRKSKGLPPVSRTGKLTIVRVPSGSPNRYIVSVLNYLKGRNYDLIQVDNRPHYAAKIKAAFPRTPVSLFLHSLTFVRNTSAVAASMAKPDLIVANSDSLKAKLSERFDRLAGKIYTVHLGVDTERFKPPARRTVAPGQFRVLFAGRVIPRKGVPVLIKAIELVRRECAGASLMVVGGGKAGYLRELRRLAGKHRVPVRFVGKVPHRQIDRYFRQADCFACPSQEHEAFGLVNVEAMASGLPVVASNIGGIGEIVGHGHNGYLVKPYSDPREHAKWILQLAKHPEAAAKMSKQARRDAVSKFGWNQTAANLMKIYNRYVS